MDNDKLIKKSIFKQKVFAKRYELSRHKTWYRSNEYVINEYNSTLIREDKIFSCDLEMPMLEINEKFYIEELDKSVKIIERLRTSNESVVYYIESLLIDDEDTEKSKVEAENKLLKTKEYQELYKKLSEYESSIFYKLYNFFKTKQTKL